MSGRAERRGDDATLRLSFEGGTLLLEATSGGPDPAGLELPGFVPDARAGDRLRAPAIEYRRALGTLIHAGHRVDDQARAYEELELVPRRTREPFPHQTEALAEWRRRGRRGIVVLPTGAGKSYVAELAMAITGRSTLVVAPTIDLMNQWFSLLKAVFGAEQVGAIGGGLYDPKPLTATTYDSAYIHMDRLGDRFGLVVFDECHHLPGPSYSQAAECALAPFRLGLTATLERADGAHEGLTRLIGPVVYRRGIHDLAGLYLADYEVVRLSVALSDEERQRYERARAEYRQFVEGMGIRVSSPGGWGRFIQLSSYSQRGRSAWRAWREQKRIALMCEAKFELLRELLVQHASDQLIIFTADNDTVYELSRRHLIPAITHQTGTGERQQLLEDFNAGALRAVVTSRVLNEGIDMPAANVGVVLSGSGSVREHVQRLGRILRKQEDKQAILYEIITDDTGEVQVSERRREHGAYR